MRPALGASLPTRRIFVVLMACALAGSMSMSISADEMLCRLAADALPRGCRCALQRWVSCSLLTESLAAARALTPRATAPLEGPVRCQRLRKRATLICIMPHEVVTVQVGQCGNQIGTRFWDLALREHAASNQDGVFDDALSTFFRNVDARHDHPTDIPIGDGKRPISALRARAVLVDTEEGVVSQLLRSPLAEIFDRSHIVTDVSGAGNNWAHGHAVYGPAHRDAFLEAVRSAVESCDSLQCFSLIHSLGGGTGSGLGTYLISALEDEYPRTLRFATSVFPSVNDDVITSPYNSTLAVAQLVEHADAVFAVDNAALASLTSRATASSPGDGGRASALTDNASGKGVGGVGGSGGRARAFDGMNNLVAHMLANLTASVRFPGALNFDLSDLTSSLVPFPRMHFLVPALAPLYAPRDLRYQSKRLEGLFSDVFHPQAQLMSSVDLRHSTLLA